MSYWSPFMVKYEEKGGSELLFKNRDTISKNIRKIREKALKCDVNSIVDEMQEYYSNNNFDSKLLLKRLGEIQMDSPFPELLYSALIGAVVGIMFSYIESLFESDFITSLIQFVIIIVTVIFMIFGIKKLYESIWKNRGLDYYLDEKEVEIIKNILEGRRDKVK